MKAFLVLALLTLVPTQASVNPQNKSDLEVLSLNVKAQVLLPPSDLLYPDLPDAVTRPNPNAGRPNNRIESETERIERQTNQRIQNMHAVESLRREPNSRSSSVKVYESEAEIKNNSAKTITGFAWGYQASTDLQYTEDQEFICSVKMPAGETKRVKVVSLHPNQKVVTVSGSGAVANPAKPTLKDVIINQVQYSDGTTWKRANWNPIVLARLGSTKVEKGKCIQF